MFVSFTFSLLHYNFYIRLCLSFHIQIMWYTHTNTIVLSVFEFLYEKSTQDIKQVHYKIIILTLWIIGYYILPD